MNESSKVISIFLVLFLLAVFFASSASLFLWERVPLLKYLEFLALSLCGRREHGFCMWIPVPPSVAGKAGQRMDWWES